MSVILFLLIVVMLVVAHEFGHFLAAKFFGVRVDEFAVGFPPKLLSKKKGETTYSINALPFGGYVKIYGENFDEISSLASDHKRSFVHQPKLKQVAIVFAGVLFNAILAWILFSAAFSIGLPTAFSAGEYEKYSKDVNLVVTGILPNSPAEKAGISVGDKILEVGTAAPEYFGTPLIPESKRINSLTPEGLQEFVIKHEEKIAVIMEREGERKAFFVEPVREIYGDRPAIGLMTNMIGTVKFPIHKAVFEGGKMTAIFLKETVTGLYDLVKKALLGEGSLDSVSGPVGLVKIVGEASSLGFASLLGFTAIISINLAIINLIPIPALDGGRLLFILIEGIMRKPIKPSVANAVNGLGFILLILLMVVVTYNDIMRILG